jgi:hypothetical protein
MKNDELLKLDLDGWPLPDKFLIEIGRVSALWAGLETLLNVCVGKLAGFNESDERWFILVNHSSFPQRLDMLGSLCQHLADSHPSLKGHREVVSALRSAQTSRNKFMHYSMAFNPETSRIEMAVGSARGSVKVAVEPVEVADIRRTVIQIHEAMRALYTLVLGKVIPSITEKPCRNAVDE